MTEALKLSKLKFSYHRDVHTMQEARKIWEYLKEHKRELPDDLRELTEKAQSNIKILEDYEKFLEGK